MVTLNSLFIFIFYFFGGRSVGHYLPPEPKVKGKRTTTATGNEGKGREGRGEKRREEKRREETRREEEQGKEEEGEKRVVL
jgi:hypothetical protein